MSENGSTSPPIDKRSTDAPGPKLAAHQPPTGLYRPLAAVLADPDLPVPDGPPLALQADHLQELRQWWNDTAADAIEHSIDKIAEYGGANSAALDLIDVGRDLARIAGRQVTDQEATELGIYFYLRGKFSRWAAAIVEGRRPSDDTLFDTMFYAMMALRNRDAGGWPWANLEVGQ